MTTALERAADPDRLALTLANYKALLKRPLLALPLSIRPDALALWTCHRHLAGMESPMAIAASVAVWIDRHGLTEADAADVLAAMLGPERMGAFKFASDLMTALAAGAADKIARRRQIEESERRKKQSEADRAAAAPADQVRDLLAGFGQLPK